MARKFYVLLVAAATGAPAVPATAESTGFNMRVTVGMSCTVRHMPVAVTGSAQDYLVTLGQIRELCNAPRGYELVVTYTPGTLEGTVLMAGSDQVILNGSGQAVISRETQPRIRTRALRAVPGENGFDTDKLLLELRPS